MASFEGTEKTAAICEQCGSIFAARLWPDGTVRPIGTGERCPCGSERFRLVE
ncbi:hypothetical protein ACFOZ7_05430 [Natribaculum luteum]|uniref:Small CPxCG-related zinc finger protein n=1 Tax=Natribaculum luteum TaxID=1586232 RepID=A0ABD5NWG0_9EURY|nr:hypothetical protein [Natribaculum luteum]